MKTIQQRLSLLEKTLGIRESRILDVDDEPLFLTPRFQWEDEARLAKLFNTLELASRMMRKYGGDDVMGIDDQFAVIRYPESDEY